jgi:opacity protein-like surface antigen
MNNAFFNFLISIIVITTCTTALADDNITITPKPSSVISYARNGFSIGVDEGFNDPGILGWGAYIGYDFAVQPKTLIGVELGYKGVKGIQSSILFIFLHDSEQDASDLLLTAHYYIARGWHIFGKTGLAYVEARHTGQCIWCSGITHKERRIEPELSIGTGYTFFGRFDVHAAYTYIGGSNNHENQHLKATVFSTNMLMLGISYKF